MGQAVEQRGRHFGIAEDGRPLAEGEVCSDDDRGTLIESADKVEEELAAGLGERQISELIENDEVQACHLIGETALSSVAGFSLEAVYKINHIVEAASCPGADAASGNGDGKMGLASAGAADQHDIALLGDEATAGKVVDERLVNRRTLELEVIEVLGERQLGDGELVLIERACFSPISAFSRSPMMRWGSCWRLTAVAMISSKAAFMP